MSEENQKPPQKASDVPATQGMLYGVRNELMVKFRSLDKKFDSKFNELKSEIYSMKVIAEEQNARNTAVLDHLSNLYFRQERVETKADNLQKFIDNVSLK